MKYYHITKPGNLKSIKVRGILPAINVRRKGMTIGTIQTDVFVTSDVKKVLLGHAGIKWVNRWKPIVIEIDAIGLKLEPVKYRDGSTYTISDFEFTVPEIDQERIVRCSSYTDFLDGLVAPMV